MSASFPIRDTVGAWVPHGRFVVPGVPGGPLAGLTFAVKDVFDVAGHATGAGNPAWLATHPVPNSSSPIVECLLEAGATLVGKTLTDELAFSIHGANVHYGTPRNARAPGRVAGGSSSGSAAAVAARLVDFALGTDTGGSTRVPASYCGLWGLRTTHGLLPAGAMVPLQPGFDTPTWMAHDAATFERVADVLLAPAGMRRPFTHALLSDDLLDHADPVFRPFARRVHAALARLMETRHARLAPPDALDGWRATYVALAAHEAWQTHGAWIDGARPAFGAAIAGRWEQARAAAALPSAAERIKAARAGQAAVRAAVRAQLGEQGVAVLPSAATVAPLLDAPEDEIDRVRGRTFNLTCVAGLAGLPQVSIPGTTEDGLPIGMSLLGPAGSDRALVRLAVEVAALLDHEGGR